MVKQVIVIRKDLNMRKGKMCAQACHAARGFIESQLQSILDADRTNVAGVYIDPEVKQWFREGTTTITVGVDSEKELLDIYSQAKGAGLKAHIVLDEGRTEFNNQPTHTAVAIGPCYDWQIDKITGELKLL